MPSGWEQAANAGLAGIVATLACGLGVLPILSRRFDVRRQVPVAYAFTGGLMFAVSIVDLIGPNLRDADWAGTLLLVLGVGLGCGFVHLAESHVDVEALRARGVVGTGSKRGFLIFLAMFVHSIPEGIAVGVAFAAGSPALGVAVAIAIAIHNMPEGLAVAIPYRADGASVTRCFFLAALTSIPQPIVAVPAALAVQSVEPLLVPGFGFAAGAMMYLVLIELIPEALDSPQRPRLFAWAFMIGFVAMLLVEALVNSLLQT